MIFKIHYFSFNAGLSGVLIMLTVFLRKYSDASSTEVGTLLMVLPFVSVFTKPYFCSLADRHQRHKLYLILALLFTLIGFGGYTFLPFFPEFIAAHGRAAWYVLVVFTTIGYIAFGVVWCLGDACAANLSHKSGESFGLIRLWGTVGWGVSGALVGTLSPYVELPEMVLGFLIFIVTHVLEILLLVWWPDKSDFEMGDSPSGDAGRQATITEKPSGARPTADSSQLELSLSNLRAGQLSITRTESNSLAITTKVKLEEHHLPSERLDQTIKDLVSRCSVGCGALAQPSASPSGNCLESAAKRARDLVARERVADLQWTIFRLVASRHKSLIKYLVIFTLLGTVFNIHWSYFFLHLEQLAAEGKGGDFSTLVGMCLVAQSVGETFCFVIAPWVCARLGRDGSISLNIVAYALRYFGNGLGIPLVSPFVAVLTESLQGINYGIFYYLITDTALHYALTVDELIPEMLERKLIDKSVDLAMVRTSLRATMQGVFSGAFDGLGFGLGSLIAGLVLERHGYEQLWCYSGAAVLVIFVLHAAYEAASRWRRRASSAARAANKLAAGHSCSIC